MEMTSTSTFSQDRNAGMVMNKTLRKTLLNYTIVKQFIIKKLQMVLKRRSTIKNVQKSLFRAPVPVKMEIYDDVAVYENQDIAGYTCF